MAKRKAHDERVAMEAFWVCVGWDKDAKRMRWFNECTNQPAFQADDCEDWVIGEDRDG